MKVLFFLIHLGLGALAAWQSVLLYRSFTGPPVTIVLEMPAPKASDPETAGGSLGADSRGKAVNHKPEGKGAEVQAIVKRNLFGVLREKPPAEPPPKTAEKPVLEKTRLRLALWGTVAGETDGECWAVIEDQKSRSQGLYRPGDQVQGARIKTIFRNRVILTLNGEDQVLEAQTTDKPGAGSGAAPVSGIATTAGIAPPVAVKIPVKGDDRNPGELIRDMKTRPYLKNGKPAGLLVYGVRPDSGIKSLGLRNGDIIRTINGTEVAGPEDLGLVAGNLSSAPDLQISLMRRGRLQEVEYNGQTRAFTTRAAAVQ
ncbi:MAG: hypothetical protein MI802_22215 [Desulfobacterales bacterium]|nr:hypothetical protein [Desulfobacterales bacterium]